MRQFDDDKPHQFDNWIIKKAIQIAVLTDPAVARLPNHCCHLSRPEEPSSNYQIIKSSNQLTFAV
jgi:hypothetical protein